MHLDRGKSGVQVCMWIGVQAGYRVQVCIWTEAQAGYSGACRPGYRGVSGVHVDRGTQAGWRDSCSQSAHPNLDMD